jgi:hypothetical protein
MHGISQEQFLHSVSTFLGSFYLLMAVMNSFVAYRDWTSGKSKTLAKLPGGMEINSSILWLVFAVVLTVLAAIAYSGDPKVMWLISVPKPIQAGVNWAMGPTTYTLGSLVLFSLLFVTRKYWTPPIAAWIILNLAMLALALSMTNPSFADIVAKPDNVPIVGLVFLLGFFTWIATRQAVVNDERAKQGLPSLEKLDDEKILVWPDLVYTELICMVALTAFLFLWAIMLPAPLEEPASAVKTPNPSKAPWYFLGLQEMLVYFDPWMAGVVLPGTVVVGLMAIPYIDFNKKGNGYYTIEERKFAYLTFQFGFFVLWVTLIVMGTFLRGPNWNFFGPYEYWDAHKVEALNNIDLAQIFWVKMLNMARPAAPEGSGEFVKLLYAILRESPGIVLTIGYLAVLPPLFLVMPVVGGFFREMFIKMGLIRYMVFTNLLLMMGALPIKMLLRWTINLKYFIAMPEYLLNL